MDHIEAPSYENSGIANAGGRRSTAVLGPTGSLLGGGSDAVSTLPPAIGAARLRHPASSFKAGHLLNAEFGGSGSDPDNLTILSATGNANHKGFDNPVKRAVMFLRKAYYALWADDIDVSQLDLGIHVEIRVRTDLPWGGPPDHVIFQGLECEAALSDWAPLSSSFSRDPHTGEYSRWRNEFLDRVTDAEGELIDANFNNEVANRP